MLHMQSAVNRPKPIVGMRYIELHEHRMLYKNFYRAALTDQGQMANRMYWPGKIGQFLSFKSLPKSLLQVSLQVFQFAYYTLCPKLYKKPLFVFFHNKKRLTFVSKKENVRF